MRLKEQVCSRRLAEKLKELGVPQESEFYWEHWVRNCDIPACNCGSIHDSWDLQRADMIGFEPICAAFTVAELGELLGHYPPYSKADVCKTEADHRAHLLIQSLAPDQSEHIKAAENQHGGGM